jgi:hypothetical protein
MFDRRPSLHMVVTLINLDGLVKSPKSRHSREACPRAGGERESRSL